jgi:hypothetical protein
VTASLDFSGEVMKALKWPAQVGTMSYLRCHITPSSTYFTIYPSMLAL